MDELQDLKNELKEIKEQLSLLLSSSQKQISNIVFMSG